MGYVMSLPVGEFFELLAQAAEKQREEYARQEWLAFLPWMTEQNKMPWDEFYTSWKPAKQPTPRRTDEEILSDARRIRERAGV